MDAGKPFGEIYSSIESGHVDSYGNKRPSIFLKLFSDWKNREVIDDWVSIGFVCQYKMQSYYKARDFPEHLAYEARSEYLTTEIRCLRTQIIIWGHHPESNELCSALEDSFAYSPFMRIQCEPVFAITDTDSRCVAEDSKMNIVGI